MNDRPGTVRVSPDGAPWFHIDADGHRYWATHDDVKNWPVRKSSEGPIAAELKWTSAPAGRF
jgi:hypothetical protein